MSQRTLGILGALLLIAGIVVSVGSDIAARHLAPASAHTPANGPRHHGGGVPGRPGSGPFFP